MAKKCVICENVVVKYAMDPSHPKKYICLKCLNGILLNSNTIDTEVETIKVAFEKAFNTFKAEWDKQRG